MSIFSKRNKFFGIFLGFLAVIGLGAGVLLVKNGTRFLSHASLFQGEYTKIYSIAWNDKPGWPEDYYGLKAALPAIKQVGFNTVWIINPWNLFEPDPVNKTFDQTRFDNLIQILDLLKANNMKAIIGLNYAFTDWSNIKADQIINDPVMYQEFIDYSKEFLTRIQSYNNMVYILIFSEGMAPSQLKGQDDEIAKLFQKTMGNFPNQIPGDLRSKFKIGFHGNYLFFPTSPGKISPIADPIPFDFLSFTAYEYEDRIFKTGTEDQVRTKLDLRLAAFKNLYPTTPIILGEYGASYCCAYGEAFCPAGETYNRDTQAKYIAYATKWAIARNLGFNLWGWKNHGAYECVQPGHAGLSITDETGYPQRAAGIIKYNINNPPSPIPIPEIKISGVTTSYTPWVVYVTGANLQYAGSARLYDNGSRWGGDIKVALAGDKSFVSFPLPSNKAPSGCNVEKTCNITVVLATATGDTSNSIQFALPSVPKTITSTINNSGVSTGYNPWAVWVTGENLELSGYARLFDGNSAWGGDIKVALAGDKSFVSFPLPSNQAPSGCNVGKECKISVVLVANGQLSNKIQFTLPAVSAPLPQQTPTPQPITINNSGVTTGYNPWAVWVTGTNIANGQLKIKLTDQGTQWGGLIEIAVASDNSFISFSLPGNSPPSNCNATGPCNIGVTLIDPSNGNTSNTFSLPLPKR